MDMTITISIPPDAEANLQRRAAARGIAVSDFAREAVVEKLAVPETFAEILAPIHMATRAAGGIDVSELDDLVEQCRDEVFSQKPAPLQH
jgi:hypothetical protein